MIGFRQLQTQISTLDYWAFSSVLKVLKRLESYIREAKERKDGPARRMAELVLEDWSDQISLILRPTDKTPSSQTVVQSGNLLRTQAALKQLRALL